MNNFKKTASALAFAMITSSALAGDLGDTSDDDTKITLEVTDKVQISNISDIALGQYNGTDATFAKGTSYCVFRNGGDNYRIKLNSDQAGGFEVKSPTTGDTIPFTTAIDDDDDASDGGLAILHDAYSASYAGSDKTDCDGNNNGSIHVTFLQDDLLAATTEDDYQAVLTVLVEPI